MQESQIASYCLVAWAIVFGAMCLFTLNNRRSLNRLKDATTLPRLAFSKAAFYDPRAHMSGVQYCWVSFDRVKSRTSVRTLTHAEASEVEEMLPDEDGSVARQYGQRLEKEGWTRVSSGNASGDVWEAYFQRKQPKG